MGKTTLTLSLAARLTGGRFVGEDVGNPHLAPYHRHVAERPGTHNPHALPLHLHLLATRAGRERAVPAAGLLLTERFLWEYFHVFVHCAFAAGMLLPAEFAQLERAYARAEEDCAPPDAVVLLGCERAENLRRIAERARPGERAAFATNYLDGLAARYATLPAALALRHAQTRLLPLDVTRLGAEEAAAAVVAALRLGQ